MHHTGPTSMDAERLDLRHNACASAVETLRTQTEADTSMATLGALAAVIAHEFNGLLTPMHARAQHLLRSPDDAIRAEALANQVLETTKRGQDLIDAVLDLIPHDRHPDHPAASDATHRTWPSHNPPASATDYSRSNAPFHGEHRAGRAAESRAQSAAGADSTPSPGSRVSLRDALDRTLASIHIPESVSVECQTPDLSLPMPQAAVDQILSNLLTNAARALHRRQRGGHEPDQPESAPRLLIHAGVGTPPSPEWIARAMDPHARVAPEVSPACSTGNNPPGSDTNRSWLVVVDTGPGIAPADIDRIFEPFVSLATDTASVGTVDGRNAGSGGGMGLGLFIVRSLLIQFGGTIAAYSDLGRGTAFTVTLPLDA